MPSGASYTLDGELLDPTPDAGLIALNGAVATIAGPDEYREFVQAVWDLPLTTGTPRYYSGLLHLLSLQVLSGRFRVY